MTNRYTRIFIIGSVASRKAALALELSKRLGILCYQLDNVIWERRPGGDVKRPPQQRDEIFNQITLSGKWIIEDVLRPCFESGLKRADLIILLDTPERSWWRTAYRRVKRLLRFERSSRAPAVQTMKSQGGALDFKRNIPAFMKKLEPYQSKVLVLKDQNDINSMFDKLT